MTLFMIDKINPLADRQFLKTGWGSTRSKSSSFNDEITAVSCCLAVSNSCFASMTDIRFCSGSRCDGAYRLFVLSSINSIGFLRFLNGASFACFDKRVCAVSSIFFKWSRTSRTLHSSAAGFRLNSSSESPFSSSQVCCLASLKCSSYLLL